METVKNIAASLSVAAVTIGAVYIICPDGVMNKGARYIAGLIMILAIILPISRTDIDLDYEVGKQKIEINAGKMFDAQIKYIAEESLRKENIYFEEIEVFTDISRDGSISIYRIYLYGVKDRSAESVIKQNLSGCEVIFKDD